MWTFLVGMVAGAVLLIIVLVAVAIRQRLQGRASSVRTVHPDGSETVETERRERREPSASSDEPGPNSIMTADENVHAVLRQGHK